MGPRLFERRQGQRCAESVEPPVRKRAAIKGKAPRTTLALDQCLLVRMKRRGATITHFSPLTEWCPRNSQLPRQGRGRNFRWSWPSCNGSPPSLRQSDRRSMPGAGLLKIFFDRANHPVTTMHSAAVASDNVERARDRVAGHRKTAGERLNVHEAEGVGAARKNEHIAGAISRSELGAVLRAKKQERRGIAPEVRPARARLRPPPLTLRPGSRGTPRCFSRRRRGRHRGGSDGAS